MIKLFEVAFSRIFNKSINILFFKVNLVRLNFMYNRGFVPGRVAFMTMFTSLYVIEFLVLLPVNLFEPGIGSAVNLRTDLSRRKSPGSVDAQRVRSAAPGTDFTFEKFCPFFFPFL